MDGKRYQVVHPVLPMDLLGVYILLPEQLLALLFVHKKYMFTKSEHIKKVNTCR